MPFAELDVAISGAGDGARRGCRRPAPFGRARIGGSPGTIREPGESNGWFVCCGLPRWAKIDTVIYQRWRTPARLAAAGLFLALAAGCGSGSAPSTTTSAPNASPTATETTSATAAPTRPPNQTTGGGGGGGSGSPMCTTEHLQISLGPSEGAAGSVYRTVIFRNTGSVTCHLGGFPGVSYVAGSDSHQVGAAAAMSGDRGADVQLAPGGTAGAAVQMVNVANYDAAACRPTAVDGVRVYPPGNTGSQVVPLQTTGCAGSPPGNQLTVQAMRAG